jgi:carbon catabolite-derepressing protein kinase
MTSTLDDEDLSLSISSSSNARRNSRDNRPQNGGPVNPVPNEPRMQQPTQQRPPVSRASQRLGQYKIVKTLGEGSFGKVKLAVHEISQQQVALKIISRRKLVTRDMAGRIEREIQYLQLLRHPHIIKLYTVITTPSEIIMVLEYAGKERRLA